MNRLGGVSRRRALLGLAAAIVAGGFVVALVNMGAGLTARPAVQTLPVSSGFDQSIASNYILGAHESNPPSSPYQTVVVSQAETASTTSGGGTAAASNGTQGSPGGDIEISTSLVLSASSPEQTASAVSALAYSVGGYVAYQSTYNSSAYVVIRVPAAEYRAVLGQVEGMGSFVSLTTNSNDVTVQYTDLNATLISLQTEQGALLKLLNESSTVNGTLAIESQLQQVNQQINEVESQILQTRTLIAYATISVTVGETSAPSPLSLTLSVTPDNGTVPLSVTFNAVVKGGSQPYVVNYNFGDGYAAQGQILIHTYYEPGDYNVLVSVTDQNGTVVERSATVKVVAPGVGSGFSTFINTVGGLLVGVVEGIVEVAVVALPIAAVGAAILIPLRRKNQKPVRQDQ
ncbi:MAG: DUF4349 domain-containing protein [Nitrososphaerota archaeon]|nr:DUF4349 domain-containing protein [Nitrososphaerota archaeon]